MVKLCLIFLSFTVTKWLEFSRFLNCSEEILSFGVPSLEVIIRTAIEFASYSCPRTREEEEQTRAAPVPGPSPTVWVTTI